MVKPVSAFRKRANTCAAIQATALRVLTPVGLKPGGPSWPLRSVELNMVQPTTDQRASIAARSLVVAGGPGHARCFLPGACEIGSVA